MVCSFIGCIGNTLAAIYFAPRYRYHSALIYGFITINDVGIALLCLPMALPYFTATRRGVILEVPALCEIYGISWNLASRFSVFLVAVLSITRTYTLYFPFRQLKKKLLLGFLLLYFLVLLIQALVPYIRSHHYVYYPEYVQCFSLLGDLFTPKCPEFIISYLVFIQLEFILPLFPILISCGMSIKIIKTVKIQAHVQGLVSRRRGATITIIIFTILYIVFNIPAVMFEIMGTIEIYSYGKYSFFHWDTDYRYFRNMISAVSVGVNASINPCLYLLRMDSFRASTRYTCKRIISKITLTSISSNNGLKSRNRTLTTTDI